MTLHSVFDNVGGVRVHARVSSELPASGPPIVFVHGLGVSTSYMAPTMTRLSAAGHQVAGLDLPGFGRSGTPRRAYSQAQLTDSLMQWLDVRNIGPAVFVGNSFGCQIIVECVTREPSRAVGVVLNAPTMDPTHRSVPGQLLRVIADIPREPFSLALIVMRDYLRVGPLRLLSTLRSALADRVEERLPEIVAPALIVCGARDPVVTVAWGQEVTQLIGRAHPAARGATLEIVPHAAHALPYDDPVTFSALIAAFVSQLR